MPPKKDSKQLVDWPANSPADLSKRAATPTVVTSMAVHLPPAMTYERPGRPANSQPTVSYESPLKKLKKALSEHTRTVIDRIDGTLAASQMEMRRKPRARAIDNSVGATQICVNSSRATT
jgi:hypothetical protein